MLCPAIKQFFANPVIEFAAGNNISDFDQQRLYGWAYTLTEKSNSPRYTLGLSNPSTFKGTIIGSIYFNCAYLQNSPKELLANEEARLNYALNYKNSKIQQALQYKQSRISQAQGGATN